MSRPSLSVAVITFNEEERLRACLESVAWADDIVVVDAESQDKTVQIAREFTDRVTVRPWPGFAAQKNFALSEARGEWVLSLDADEEVPAELRAEIERLLAGSPACDGYAIPRKNIFWGVWIRHGGLYPDLQVRLVRRKHAHFVERSVHESIVLAGRVGRLATPLLHHSYRDVSDFVVRADRYSTLAAEDLARSGRGTGLVDVLVRPVTRFLGMYVLQAGFLDGRRGLHLAALYAYYVLLRSIKAWERVRRS
jgi:glycosyltransferase involved in cell wall biosynthesis